MKKILFLLVALLLVAAGSLGVISCGSSSSTTSSGTTSSTSTVTSPTSAAAVTQISIQNFAFNPSTVTVPTGTQVTWTNKDGATHTIVSDTGAFSSQDIATGGTFSFTFTQAGTFSYHCSIHPTMKGTIVVQ